MADKIISFNEAETQGLPRRFVDAGDGTWKERVDSTVTITPGDVQIGAVEIKDHTDADRARVKAATVITEADIHVAAHDASGGVSTDAAVVTDAAGTRSGFLRGLVKWAFERMPASLGQKLMASSFPVVVASDQAAVPVDSELPIAAALADNAANPTVPGVGAHGMVWDGTSWDRERGSRGDGTAQTGAQAVGIHQFQVADTYPQVFTPRDSLDGINALSVAPHQFNGQTFDRERGNTEVTVLASAARTATVNSADQTNHNARGAHVIIDVTAITATPSITPKIQVKDPASAKYYDVLVGVAITAVGTTVLKVYPGIAASANAAASDILGRTWRVRVEHADADSITYSVGAHVVV